MGAHLYCLPHTETLTRGKANAVDGRLAIRCAEFALKWASGLLPLVRNNQSYQTPELSCNRENKAIFQQTKNQKRRWQLVRDNNEQKEGKTGDFGELLTFYNEHSLVSGDTYYCEFSEIIAQIEQNMQQKRWKKAENQCFCSCCQSATNNKSKLSRHVQTWQFSKLTPESKKNIQIRKKSCQSFHATKSHS